MTTPTLPAEVYLSKKTARIFTLTESGAGIDLANPLSGIDLNKYRRIGDNNSFIIFELKKKYRN